jgi:hypothetical protein
MGRMRSKAQWRYLFATGKPFARKWAHNTKGGKVKRYRKLPAKKRTSRRGKKR